DHGLLRQRLAGRGPPPVMGAVKPWHSTNIDASGRHDTGGGLHLAFDPVVDNDTAAPRKAPAGGLQKLGRRDAGGGFLDFPLAKPQTARRWLPPRRAIHVRRNKRNSRSRSRRCARGATRAEASVAGRNDSGAWPPPLPPTDPNSCCRRWSWGGNLRQSPS